MRHIFVVGIGTGNPDHLTLEAIRALGAVDVVFIPTKGGDKAELAEVRRAIVAQHASGAQIVEFALPVRRREGIAYVDGVADWHAQIADLHEDLIANRLAQGGAGAFLVWGDPMLYDSTLRILERVRSRRAVDFTQRVIPGITSIQALAAGHGIPLNHIGKPVTVTTGRRLAEIFPQVADRVVVMLDGEEAFLAVDDPEAQIYWGAYLGMPQEIVLSGRLADMRETIAQARRAARARHGWIMDIYLLSKGHDFDE